MIGWKNPEIVRLRARHIARAPAEGLTIHCSVGNGKHRVGKLVHLSRMAATVLRIGELGTGECVCL